MTARADSTRLLTVADVARQLGQTRDTIRRRIANGELEAYRIGEHGPFRVPADAVDELLRPAAREKAAA